MSKGSSFQSSASAYPKPGQIGGRVIREVIRFLRSQGVQLPITSHILIGVSGGADSVALAHLLSHYGRRIVSQKQISFLHINHGWRGEESNQDEIFVKDLGKRWGIPVITHQLDRPPENSGDSWEEAARIARKEIFLKESQKRGTLILTAHQADDLAETVLWRIATGAAETHGGGVTFRHGVEMRPFLTTRKSSIRSYLKENQQECREDSTNSSGRFLRARMRTRLMPELENIFPRSIEHLVSLALKAALKAQSGRPQLVYSEIDSSSKFSHISGMQSSEEEGGAPIELLIQAAGLRVRRPHLREMSKWIKDQPAGKEIHLPGGWRLLKESATHFKLLKY